VLTEGPGVLNPVAGPSADHGQPGDPVTPVLTGPPKGSDLAAAPKPVPLVDHKTPAPVVAGDDGPGKASGADQHPGTDPASGDPVVPVGSTEPVTHKPGFHLADPPDSFSFVPKPGTSDPVLLPDHEPVLIPDPAPDHTLLPDVLPVHDPVLPEHPVLSDYHLV
jgi:hypothetical protein